MPSNRCLSGSGTVSAASLVRARLANEHVGKRARWSSYAAFVLMASLLFQWSLAAAQGSEGAGIVVGVESAEYLSLSIWSGAGPSADRAAASAAPRYLLSGN